MACARCDFYRPRESSLALLLDAKDNILRFLQQIPLTDEERASVDGDLNAIDRLTQHLADRPTPSGQTLAELKTDRWRGTRPTERRRARRGSGAARAGCRRTLRLEGLDGPSFANLPHPRTTDARIPTTRRRASDRSARLGSTKNRGVNLDGVTG